MVDGPGVVVVGAGLQQRSGHVVEHVAGGQTEDGVLDAGVVLGDGGDVEVGIGAGEQGASIAEGDEIWR